MDSRWVFGAVGPNPVSFAIKVAKPPLFTSGVAIVDNVRLLATLFAEGELRGDGDGDPPVVRGVSSRLIVLVSTLASAGAWREFRLITPARIPDESL